MTTDLYSSWDAYYATLQERRESRGQCDDGRCYLPTPEEIEQRKNDLDWLKEMGFGPCALESIMRYDHPTIDWIDKQINERGHTPEQVMKRIEPFLVCPMHLKK